MTAPTTTEELNELARAVTELADALASTRLVLARVAVACKLDPGAIRPPEGRGLNFARRRIAAVDAGQFGEQQVERILSEIAQSRSRAALGGGPPQDANDPDGSKRAERIAALRKSGERVFIGRDGRGRDGR